MTRPDGSPHGCGPHDAGDSVDAGPLAPPLLEETIGQVVARVAAATPDAEALVDVAAGRRWTYRQLAAETDRLARALMALGVQRGDRVGIWAPNCGEWVVVQYATAAIGAILVTVNPAYRTDELAFVLNQSGVETLVAATGFKRSDYAAMIAQVRPRCPQLREVIFVGQPSWAALLDGAARVPGARLRTRQAELRCRDPINIQYTSGTTGFPKGATLSHHNIVNNGFFVTELIGLGPADRLCVPVPFYHCFGMVMGNLGALSHGATVVIPTAGFDAGATLAAIDAERCTAVYGVPTMFAALLDHPVLPEADVSTLRTGIMAGAVCPAPLLTRCVSELHLQDLAIAYGMTETSPVSCQSRSGDAPERRSATVGRVHPHLQIKIVDPISGAIVKRGRPGEFCTRGYSVMLGYWGQPDATRAAIDDDGWMHSGDLAVMGEDGYCAIVGRLNDMVIRGGENLYPREIEEFLLTHPDIADVQVVGVPDDTYGEELCAWLLMKPGRPALDAPGLREFAADRLAHHKIPRYVEVADAFPMTVTGKIRKTELRRRSIALLGLADPTPVGEVSPHRARLPGTRRPGYT
ncbi:AMP-binding protein [Mycolicibacillus parakoreensis]|uniref:AMP-binding protein n=1 Tax=Mycolicibacillus parakoreensis TaxID=1069221 RepID=A0ABY3U241_9MYCO|nr:AMP-binding protein [Mycolicibacillus parakoreensis]MCV7317334.1 AMP-binding protein [Mycolicibacillus parakoreensis]ULN51627.1 AMP-binding protein [Mycolicibacillus parakoreensis]